MKGCSAALYRAVQTLPRVFRREPWWAEFWSAITALAWAGLSWGDAHDPDAWRSMQVLMHLGGERTWHLLAGGLGLAQLLFLLADHRWLRWGGAVAGCWFWAVLMLSVWITVPWAPAVAAYAGWCGINAFSILRLLRRHG